MPGGETDLNRLNTMNYQAGALSIAIGVVHTMADFEYWGVWWGYGLFFILTALLQVAFGLVLFLQPWRYGEGGTEHTGGHSVVRDLYRLGIAANAGIVVLWIVAHTLGVPLFGPNAGQSEPVTFVSVIALGLMLLLIWQQLVLLRELRPPTGKPMRVTIDPSHYE